MYERIVSVMGGAFHQEESKRAIDAMSDALDFPLYSVLYVISSFQKDDRCLGRLALEKLMDELFIKMEFGPNMLEELERTKANFLGLFSMVHGSSVSGSFINSSLPSLSYNRDILLSLSSFMRAEPTGIAVLCESLGIAAAKAAISELF